MSVSTRIEILRIIKRIRDSFDDSVEVYTSGSCVKFAMILKEIYPEGQILYDQEHALFEIKGVCYDIEGINKKTKKHMPIQDWGLLQSYDMMNSKYKK